MAKSARDERLCAALDAMSNPLRVALLRELRTPKTLTEIALHAEDATRPDESRLLARQTVKVHLDRLLAPGLVVATETERLGRATLEYTLNNAMVFAYAEELRELAKVRPSTEPDVATLDQPGAEPSPAEQRPALVMVKGLEEGRVFPLSPQADRWMVGRAASCAVALHYDPYVSGENALVSRVGDGYVVQDVGRSRNGTHVNFRRLPPGASAPLRNADLLGVGRTLLLLRT